MRTAGALKVDPNAVGAPNARWETRTLAQRFWSHVDKSGPCWLWTAYLNHRGYGIVGLNNRRTASAHRVSWSMVNGAIPPRMLALHSRACVSRACVRPDHLRLGTQLENVADTLALRRAACQRPDFGVHGEANYNARLSLDQVIGLRERAAATGEGYCVLGRAYGISQSVVRRILYGIAWKRAGGPIRARAALPAAARLGGAAP